MKFLNWIRNRDGLKISHTIRMMAQQLGVLKGFVRDQHLIFSTQIRHLTTACISSYIESKTFGLPQGIFMHVVHINSYRHTYIDVNKDK